MQCFNVLTFCIFPKISSFASKMLCNLNLLILITSTQTEGKDIFLGCHLCTNLIIWNKNARGLQ